MNEKHTYTMRQLAVQIAAIVSITIERGNATNNFFVLADMLEDFSDVTTSEVGSRFLWCLTDSASVFSSDFVKFVTMKDRFTENSEFASATYLIVHTDKNEFLFEELPN